MHLKIFSYFQSNCLIQWIIFSILQQKVAGNVDQDNATWVADFEHISSDGDIQPIAFNPAFRDWRNDTSRGHLNPEGRREKSKGRIVGGFDSNVGQVPYQIAIHVRGRGLWCGGSIYNRRTIVTAAHCFYASNSFMDKERFIFVAGDTDLSTREGTEMQRLAAQVIVHPDYHPSRNTVFDVAIVKLKVPLRYTHEIQPLLPGNPAEDGTAVVSGWGYTRQRKPGEAFSSGGFTSFLQHTTITILKRSVCADLFAKFSLELKELALHPNHICAGVLEGGRDACQGDSGGPLACLDPSGKKYLCGIVSSGIGCGLPGTPGFYMNVSVFTDWLEAEAGKPDTPKRS